MKKATAPSKKVSSQQIESSQKSESFPKASSFDDAESRWVAEVAQTQVATKSIIRFWFLGLVFVLLGYLFFQSLNIVYLILTALIISVSMEGIILSFEKKLKHRGGAIAISYLLLMIFLVSGLVFIIPFLISQISMLITWISSVVIQLKNFIVSNSRPSAIHQISRLPEILKEYLFEHWKSFSRSNADFQATILSSLNTLLDSSVSYLKQFSSGFFSFIGGFFGVLANITIIFTLAVFFSIEKSYLTHLVVRGSTVSKRMKIQNKVNRVYEKLSLWLKARIWLSLFVSLAMYLSFRVLKWFGIALPSMVSLSLIAGLLDIIPYLGPMLAFIPIIVLALIYNGFWGMIIVGAVFFAIQWVQNNVITPLLMEKQLGVNPLLILVSALLGATVMGFWGIVLSVPLAVIIGLFIDEKE